jgi:hypothetical protein
MNSTSTMNVDESTRLGVGRYLDMPSRKISVSFVSEVAPTCNSIDPTQAFHYGPDPNLKALQQKILRLQVSQVMVKTKIKHHYEDLSKQSHAFVS